MSLRGGYFIVDMSPLPPIKGGISSGDKSPEAMTLIDNMIKSGTRVFLMSGLRFADQYGTLVQQDAWCPAVDAQLTGIEELTNAEFKIPVKNVWTPSKSGASTVTTYVICFSKTDGIYYEKVTNSYKDYSDYQKEFLRTDGQNSMSANLNLNSHKLVNLATPTAGTDGAHKRYVDDKISQQLSNYAQWFCSNNGGEIGGQSVNFTVTPNGAITTTALSLFPSLASTVKVSISKNQWDIIKQYNNISSDTDFQFSYFIVYKLHSSEATANNVGEADHKFLSSPLIETTAGIGNGFSKDKFTFDIHGSINGGNPYNATNFYFGVKFGKRIII